MTFVMARLQQKLASLANVVKPRCRIISGMDRILDKFILLILCAGLMLITGITTLSIIGMLAAISLAALFELPSLPRWMHALCPCLYCLLALFVPAFVVFLPLAAADLFRLRPLWLRGVWLVLLIAMMALPDIFETQTSLIYWAAVLSALGCLLSWRGSRNAEERKAARIERDNFAQASSSLELRNRDLQERQELQLQLATLNERSRIAREIHDNVGHLLTRSVLQIKALRVMHVNDAQLSADLEQVGATLDTAFKTVRASVHDLHDEAQSLETQLQALAQSNQGIEVQVEYRADEVPSRIAFSFLAITREALSNSVRHSNATCAQVSVVEFPGLYQLVVQDNGSLPATQLSETSEVKACGIGLTTMEERARALGGVFRTSYDKGFRVFISIPKSQTE